MAKDPQALKIKHRQARKRARQNIKRRARNMSERAAVRTYIKKFYKVLETNDLAGAQEAFKTACAKIDRSAQKGLQHKNKASRLKSRMNARLKELAAASD